MRPRPKGFAAPRRDRHRGVGQLRHERLQCRGTEVAGTPAHFQNPGMAGIRPLSVVPPVGAPEDGEPHLLPCDALGGQK
eukprot:6243985-Alexandrium_andersonii.AAC.1